MFILHEKDGGLRGDRGPCGSGAFPRPTSQQVAALKHGLAEGQCDPEDRSVDGRVSTIR